MKRMTWVFDLGNQMDGFTKDITQWKKINLRENYKLIQFSY